MKLANLTDANIFFLVETPQGRKFSGKRHLCDLYVGGELAPLGDDVEFEIDPSVSAIHERFVGGDGEEELGMFTEADIEAFNQNDLNLDSVFSGADANSSNFFDDSFEAQSGGGVGGGNGRLRKILPSPFSRQPQPKHPPPSRRRVNPSSSSPRKSMRMGMTEVATSGNLTVQV